MPKSTPSPSDKRATRAARAVQRAIGKDNPAKEPPTVGKPVIIDPPEDAKPAVKDPDKSKQD
jgi:hypothetical protein